MIAERRINPHSAIPIYEGENRRSVTIKTFSLPNDGPFPSPEPLIRLTRTEKKLFNKLRENLNIVVSNLELKEAMGKNASDEELRYYIMRLRRRVVPFMPIDPKSRPQIIRAIKGYGHVLIDPTSLDREAPDSSQQNEYPLEGITYYPAGYAVDVVGEKNKAFLTKNEKKIFDLLLKERGMVVSDEIIAREIYEGRSKKVTDTIANVRKYILGLRRKLEPSSSRKGGFHTILTVRGEGHMMPASPT